MRKPNAILFGLFLFVLLCAGALVRMGTASSVRASLDHKSASPPALTPAPIVAASRRWVAERIVVATTGKMPPHFEPKALNKMLADPNIRDEDLYNAEVRHEPWATAMEQNVKDRFDPAFVKSLGMPGLKATDVECRESLCRLDVSWTQQDVDVWGDDMGKDDPATMLQWNSGQLAYSMNRLPLGPMDKAAVGWNIRQLPDGTFDVVYLLAFNDEDGDPGHYREAAARSLAKMPKRQLPPK